MGGSSALYGIVDLGTWTIRFSISSVQPQHARIMPCVFQDRAPIRLYKGAHGRITEQEIRQTIVVLRRFCLICRDYGVPSNHIQIAANPHEAPNFDELVAAISTDLGLEVLRLNKQGEHWANAYGVASSTYQARGLYIELRPSYASTYFLSLCRAENSEESLSGPVKVPFGTFRLDDQTPPHSTTQSPAQSANQSPAGSSSDLADHLDDAALENFSARLYDACLSLLASSTSDSHGSASGSASESASGSASGSASSSHNSPTNAQGSTSARSSSNSPASNATSDLASNSASDLASTSDCFGPRTVFLSASGFSGLHTLLSTVAVGFGFVTTGLVLKPEQLANVQGSSRLAEVVRVIGEVLRGRASRVLFVHHNLRNGLLFQALPPEIRYQDPLLVATRPYALPGATKLAAKLQDALPPRLCPAVIRNRLAPAAANAAYIHSSYNRELQSFSALAVAENGVLAGTHGITNEEKVLLGLTLCERWGGRLNGDAVHIRHRMIESLIDPKLAWWASYTGLVLHLLGAAFPGAHLRERALELSTKLHSAETNAETSIDTTTQFTLVVTLFKDAIYSKNVIMDERIGRVRTKLAKLGGIELAVVETEV